MANFAFMHNRQIGGFAKIKRYVAQSLSDEAYNAIKGSIDSEYLFATFIDKFVRLPQMELWDRIATSMMQAIRRVLDLINEHTKDSASYINLVLTNGHLALAVRLTTDKPSEADSLYINLGKKYICENGICHMGSPSEYEKSVILVHEGKIRDRMTINLDY